MLTIFLQAITFIVLYPYTLYFTSFSLFKSIIFLLFGNLNYSGILNRNSPILNGLFCTSALSESGRIQNYYHHYHIYWDAAVRIAHSANTFDLALINNHYCTRIVACAISILQSLRGKKIESATFPL